MRLYVGDQLELQDLHINNNNFGDIDGALLGNFLSKSRNLHTLCLDDCKLSGDVINTMMRLYVGDQLELQELHINNNNFGDIDGALLGNFLSKSRNLHTLRLDDCKLSGGVMNEMMRVYVVDVSQLKLLNIANNDIRSIDGNLLGNFLSKSPKLLKLYMHNCKLLGDVMNEMMRVYVVDVPQLQLLNIANNDIGNIDGHILGNFLSKSPKLLKLYMHACKLPGDVMNTILKV
ncbi:uncharacterized protein [Antedon mediterranea]|uniref:uncharacterized protein n=1 Tax=Antedon mediterranea TaxID=105859 RepID=UPI003AF5F985